MPRAAANADGDFPVVAIGMSAGGLEAATQFLNAMPADSGAAFVIVQHLEPTRKSLLAELLGKQTKMPVVEIADGMKIAPNRVHVIIPAKTLLIEKGVFKLVEPDETRARRHPIDKFYTSLAADFGAKAIAIILTGAGSNGSAGLLDIKQAGGLGIAQDPQTAAFDSMPRYAIVSNAVDYVLPIEAMPGALLSYIGHSYVKDAPQEIVSGKGGKASLEDVLTLVRARTGHDFRQYKRNTLTRRTHRRMGLARIERLDDYVTLLREDPAELVALIKDLAINVTGFFRDPDAWDVLDRDVITPIVERMERGDNVRVWVPACSTGEEAYSIAMLLAERIEASGKDLGVKVFATDLAEQNLGTARKGIFAGSMVESLSPERLKRFFDKQGDVYQVKPDIRETVLFAPQNLLSDPPYSKMDLVSCRNLLIYLEPGAQERVLSLAHFALREGGYLFLGNSETIGAREHLFAVISKRWRIYRRVGPARSSAVDFSAWPARETRPETGASAPKLADLAIRSLAERYAPASVVIDRSYRIHHFHGQIEDYLAQPPGAPTLDLLTLARNGLRMTIRRAVQKAIDDGETATLTAGAGAKDTRITITADPLPAPADGEPLFLVTFVTGAGGQMIARARLPRPRSATANGGDFEDELKAVRDELRGTTEQFETANEELKAANEEITSVNEELQATNEELEASKEELQSLNEELTAVNSQLERKVGELEDIGDDLRNLLSGNEIATIFLDQRLRIKWFSPAIQTLFDLLDQDVGRPIANFAQKFAEVDLVGKAEAAIARLESFEEDVLADDGRCFSMRLRPYRTRDNRIAGAVASFLDITGLKVEQDRVTAARDYARAIINTVRNPMLVLDSDLRIVSANPAFYALFDMAPAEAEGRHWLELRDRYWDTPQLRELLEDLLPTQGEVNDFEVSHELPDGEHILLLNACRIPGEADRPELILIVKEDVTERRQAEAHQEMLLSELSHRVKNSLAVVQSVVAQTARSSASLDDFRTAFEGRLQSLAIANDAVIEGQWKGVDMHNLVGRATGLFGSAEQVKIGDGPAISLRPQAALAVAMVLHELGTNAVKYGALSVAKGLVAINWQITADDNAPQLAVEWNESGGPPVKAPKARGQGTKFIERSISHELKGTVEMTYAAAGFHVLLCLPLTASVAARTALPSGGGEGK